MIFTPHDYQARAIDFVMANDRCCLFLDMGMGKSVVALTAAARLLAVLDASRVLVVAPKKVAESTWSAEASKWEHLRWLSVAVAAGTAKKRAEAVDSGALITIIGRDSFVWLVDYCGARWPFDMIIIDELTSFKNRASLRTKAMRRASRMADRVVGLTGTPAPKGLIDLWSQMACVDLGRSLGPSFTRFRDRYFSYRMVNFVPMGLKPKPGADAEIMRLLAPSCLTMQAKDYLQMPPLIVEDAWVEFKPARLADYRAFERDRVAEIEGEEITAASAAALLNKLAQYANGFVYDGERKAVDIHSDKLDMLAEVYEAAQAEGSGLLVFIAFVEDRRRVLAAFPEAKAYEGDADLKGWNAGKIPMLVAHPASTAYGLNLQKGGHCIAWLGGTWDLELYQQANARLHRQGQERPVVVKRILAKGTVDEQMASSLDAKATGQQALLDGLKQVIKRTKTK